MTTPARASAPPRSLIHALEHDVPPRSGQYKWVYLWHWPIRAMHWAAALSLVLLIVTGFTIGKPYFLPQAHTTGGYFIGWMRLIHFIAAGVLVATAIVRMYWLIAGNKFERFAALFPVRKSDWINMFKQVKFYLMIHPERAPHYLGHNPLQQLAYTTVYVVGLIMVITGFAMYGQANPQGIIRSLTLWVPDLFGGMQIVRLVHHVLTWFFLIFIPIHVYLAIRADLLERTGTMSSIVTGGRFVPADKEYVDE
ncbi:MAG: Ni/Fe-hydrogenase, b-type cytochrome subunit [Gemmatimonadota bacterium]